MKIIKHKLSRLSMLIASGVLTLLGIGGCHTKKSAIEQELREKQDGQRRDSIEQQMKDSLFQETQKERIGHNVLLYGGPNMRYKKIK